MTHWRILHERDYLGVWDLMVKGQARDRVMRIESVTRSKIKAKGKDEKGRILIHFEGCTKPLIVNMTIGETLEGLFGADVEKWKGQAVTLFASTTRNPGGGPNVPCVRIKNKRPDAGAPVEHIGDGNPVDPEIQAQQKAAFEPPKET